MSQRRSLWVPRPRRNHCPVRRCKPEPCQIALAMPECALLAIIRSSEVFMDTVRQLPCQLASCRPCCFPCTDDAAALR